MSSKLFTLSTEILIKIVSLLPSQDIITFSRTCRQLRSLVLDTPLLQYLTYAHRAGVEDNLTPGLTIPDRFARLRQWEEAWNNLDAAAPTGRFELRDQPSMLRTSMLRDGFLILACFQYEPGDTVVPFFFSINLRSPSTPLRQTKIYRDIVTFEFSIEQNMIAMLHKVEEELQLSLRPFDDDDELCTDVFKVRNTNYVIRNGHMSWKDVDLKIAREFVAVLTCGTSPSDTDSFILVDWKAEDAYNVLSSPAHIYASSFCFLDHDTVALVNMLDKTIETHKILRTDDGEVSMKRFGVFKIPFVIDDHDRFLHAQWSGDCPSIPVSSPVVWPEDLEHPRSRLPFQSSLKSSVVSLTLYYLSLPLRYGECVVRAIIPRAKLLDAQSDWTESSFRLFSLDEDAGEECAIAGTRWINEGLEVFDFNEARVQRALALRRARGSAVGPGFPNPVVEATDIQARSWYEQDVSSSLPFCHTIPMNQHNNHYDDVLADDEHIVGIRYKYKRGDSGLTTDISVDVWTL
ncbi:hypothetical protein BJV78DRAFT_1250043 [Lactifluus subvellereus]|nr:hypothetical protein BJV78DRAFT_1250043 [Lactifluus subvellereus]